MRPKRISSRLAAACLVAASLPAAPGVAATASASSPLELVPSEAAQARQIALRALRASVDDARESHPEAEPARHAGLVGQAMAMNPKVFVAVSIAASLTLATSGAFADAAADIACFTSDTKTPIHFEMRTYYDRDIRFSFASIKYAKAKTAIPVVLQSDAAQDQGSGQPGEVTTTWLEVVGGTVSGSYNMVHQGANASSMTYTNFKTKKTVPFLLDTHVDSTLKKGCAWER